MFYELFFLLWFSLSFFLLFCIPLTPKVFNRTPERPEATLTPKPPTVSVNKSPENILASWTMLSSPQAASQDLSKSPILAIKNWKTQPLSSFQHIEDFKQTQSLEEVKKIILNKLLEQKINPSLVGEFLNRAEFPEGWCNVLENTTRPLWNRKNATKE